jgi:membrane associated rhomboid family serine protease
MKYLPVIVFVIIYVSFGLELGFTSAGPVWKHFTYSFQHGSIMHLVLNCISWLALFGALERFYRPRTILLVAVAVAVAISFMVSYSIPVVGASGMIYCMIGMYMCLIVRKRVHFASKINLIMFFVSVFTFLAISFFKANSAGLLHLYCLVGGFGL